MNGERDAGEAGASWLYARHVGVDLGGRPVLDDVELSIGGGAPVALTGPSGSGKTVLCLVLTGALGPTRGTVELDTGSGQPSPVSQASGRAGTTAIILQSHGLVAGLTAEENVALPLQARGVPRAQVAARVRRALEDVGLSVHGKRPVDELSGGERQRVGIARGFAADPFLLAADEPTAELDAGNRARVLDLFSAHAARGRIVVIASDDPEVVSICGTIVVLDAGRLVEPSPSRIVTDLGNRAATVPSPSTPSVRRGTYGGG